MPLIGVGESGLWVVGTWLVDGLLRSEGVTPTVSCLACLCLCRGSAVVLRPAGLRVCVGRRRLGDLAWFGL